MIKKMLFLLGTLLCITQVQAIEKNKIDLNQTFWGTWGIFNPAKACTETYQFSQPGNFIYKAKQKQLSGEFAIIRHNDAKVLDVLMMDIKEDNGLAGCSAEANNYQGKQSKLSLKWISSTSAEICIDSIGKQCTGLYLNKR